MRSICHVAEAASDCILYFRSPLQEKMASSRIIFSFKIPVSKYFSGLKKTTARATEAGPEPTNLTRLLTPRPPGWQVQVEEPGPGLRVEAEGTRMSTLSKLELFPTCLVKNEGAPGGEGKGARLHNGLFVLKNHVHRKQRGGQCTSVCGGAVRADCDAMPRAAIGA